MHSASGRSSKPTPDDAVAEATAGMAAEADIVFAFASTQQEPAGTARALAQRFPNSLVVGCTSTGEFCNGEHSNGALVVSALKTPHIRWTATCVPLANFNADVARASVSRLFSDFAIDRDDFNPEHYVATMIIDGLSMKEELVAAEFAAALDGIRLVGGSAGDDMRFQQTHVFYNGEALSGAAVIVLAYAPVGFDVFKHQHFHRSPVALAVTRVDPATRRVYEFDGRTAADAYAAALGIERAALTTEVAFVNPLVFPTSGDVYIRSVHQVLDDGSIAFYCAVEEGMVLEVGGHSDMVAALDDAVSAFKAQHGSPAFFLGFSCILRAVEMSGGKLEGAIGRGLQALSPSSLAFDTYGEHFNGLHINQTIVGVCFRDVPETGVAHV